jgi:hypothetical protein
MLAAVTAKFLPDTLVYEPGIKAVVPDDLLVVNLSTVTRAIQVEFEKELKRLVGPSIAFNQKTRLGDSIGTDLRTVTVDNQFMASMPGLYPGETKDIRERYVIPTASLLANACANRGLNVFGSLDIPLGGAEGVICTSDKTSIRGVSAYDIMTDRWLARFDVIGGHFDLPNRPEIVSRRGLLGGRA